jgi:hypothetical protein
VAGDTKPKTRTVTLRFEEIIMDCSNPQRLAEFWAQALDYEITDSDPDIAAIEDRLGDGPGICFQRVPETKLTKNRVHFDLSVDEDRLQQAVDRLLALGATLVDVGQGPDREWVVLADPERNEFCVVP